LKPRFLLVTSLTLLCLALVTVLWMRDLEASVASYQSPLQLTLPQGAPTTPLVNQVVVVVAGGLTTGTLQSMPFLGSLSLQGATASLLLGPNAQISDILTGAAPDLRQPGHSGAAPETIFATARRISGVNVVAGPAEWLSRAGAAVADGFAPPSAGEAGDAAATRYVLGRLDFWLPDLVLLVLDNPAASEPAEDGPATMSATDARLSALWQMMQIRVPGDTVLVVTGDANGAPIILAGRGVQASQGAGLTPGDLTLTLAALLGAPFPSSASGRVQYQMLALSDAVQAEKQVALAQQREALADGYLLGIGSSTTSELVESDLLVARSALAARNTDSAFRLASHSLTQADAELAAGRAERLSSERWSRLPLAAFSALPLLVWLLSLVAAAVARSPLATALGLAPQRLLRAWRPETIMGVAVGAAAWVSFQWLGLTEPKWPPLAWVLGLGALLVMTGAAWADRQAILEVERRGRTRREAAREAKRVPGPVALCGFSLTFTYLTALLPVLLYLAQGRRVTWFLPDPANLALLGESLGLLYVVALLLAALPWAGAMLHALVGLVMGLGVWFWERRRVG
jgi:hypothetical protein